MDNMTFYTLADTSTQYSEDDIFVLILGFVATYFSLALISTITNAIGRWLLFKKMGKKPWYALIPFVNVYVFSECADREKDGRRMMIYSGILELLGLSNNIFLSIANSGLVSEKTSDLFKFIFESGHFMLVYFTLSIISFIYTIRIVSGIIHVYGRKKRFWMIPWLLWGGICAIIWGASKKFQPVNKEVETAEDDKESGIVAKADDMSLSINIRKRQAQDFIHVKTLLRDIHMNIPKGHMVLLLGGSGAGKTTFLNAITGYEKADADIKIGENDVYKNYESIKYDIGFVPQADLMRGTDTVYRTLQDAATLRLPDNMTPAERRKQVDEVLERFGLTSVKNSLVDKLSGGQRKRLSICMEYISDPTLFILDEPDSGLDGVVARGLFESLRKVADQNKIVVVITHTPDRVIDLFDDVIVLSKDPHRTGRLAYYGSVEGAKEFFGKTSMEGILFAINQKDEGGEGRSEEFINKYCDYLSGTEVAS